MQGGTDHANNLESGCVEGSILGQAVFTFYFVENNRRKTHI